MQSLSWINGEFTFVPMVSAHDRGFQGADGLFETMRVEDGILCDFEAHFSRLSDGLLAFKLIVNFTKEELLTVANELIAKVPLDGGIGRLRLTVTRGVPNAGVTVFMNLSLYQRPALPLELVLSNVIRVAGNPSSKHKTLAYTDNFFAQREVTVQGENRIAVLCNQWGRVACASIGNVFVLKGGKWITPPVSEGALPGITRAKLLAAGSFEGLPVEEGEVTIDALLEGDALLTNVLRGPERGICALHRRSK